MPRWFDPLLAFLAEQPPETVTVTLALDELLAFAAGPAPRGALTRGYWRGRQPGTVGHRLAAIGWRTQSMRGRPLTITFVRQPPATSA